MISILKMLHIIIVLYCMLIVRDVYYDCNYITYYHTRPKPVILRQVIIFIASCVSNMYILESFDSFCEIRICVYYYSISPNTRDHTKVVHVYILNIYSKCNFLQIAGIKIYFFKARNCDCINM